MPSTSAIGNGPVRNVVLNSGEHKILSDILRGRPFTYEGREIGNYSIGAKFIYCSEIPEDEPVQVCAGTGSIPTCQITKKVFTRHQKLWPLLKGYASIIKYRKVPNQSNIPGLGSDINWGFQQNQETREKIGCLVLDHESFVYMFHPKSSLKQAIYTASAILRKEWNTHLVSAQGARSDQKIVWSEGMFSWNGPKETLWSKIRVSVNTYRFSRQVSETQYAEITPADVDVSIKLASTFNKRTAKVGESCDRDGIPWDMYGLTMSVPEMIALMEDNDFSQFLKDLLAKNPLIQEKVETNFEALRMTPLVPFPGSFSAAGKSGNALKTNRDPRRGGKGNKRRNQSHERNVSFKKKFEKIDEKIASVLEESSPNADPSGRSAKATPITDHNKKSPATNQANGEESFDEDIYEGMEEEKLHVNNDTDDKTVTSTTTVPEEIDL